MAAQKKIFKRQYKYKRKFINACIMRIRYGRRKPKTIQGFKTFIFKAMKDIAVKNINNYLNLLNGAECKNIPEYDEVLSECYIIFEHCIERFVVNKKNNFYFYFNKSLSRKFYRMYQKEVQNQRTDLSKEIVAYHPRLRDDSEPDTVEALMSNLHFTNLQKRICRSRMKGEKASEFLKRNRSVSDKKYNDNLRKIKEVILYYQNHNAF